MIESLLRIPDKQGRDVDFVLNVDQRAFDEARTGRDIIAKYRQGGFSSYEVGRALVNCLGKRNRRHVLLAHNTDTSQKLLSRIHYMIKHLKCPPPDLKYSTQNRIVFNKTDSHIFIGTAGSDDYGVGDTITDLHCSEVSRWPNPQALLSGLFQAVPPDGNVLIESTGRGVGNWFHRAVMRAAGGTGIGYKLHFFPWIKTPEYALRVDDPVDFMAHLDETLEEPKYAKLGLTAEQLAWRRLKLEEVEYDLRSFTENYPVTLQECFQSTGFGLFKEVNYVESPLWRGVDPWTHRLQGHPQVGHTYVAGVDVGAGIGQDFTVLQIFDVETGEQVLEWRNNMMEPDRAAVLHSKLLREFHDAYVNPERNNHGILYVKTLIKNYKHGRIHQPKRRTGRTPTNEVAALASFGTFTSDVVKALIVGALQTQLRGELTIHSSTLRDECASFVQHESGRLGAEVGCHDDCVLAAAMGAYARPSAALRHAGEVRREAVRRSPTTAQVFEAGRLFEEVVARYQQTHDPLPISSGMDWL